jgi:hypothetical protein
MSLTGSEDRVRCHIELVEICVKASDFRAGFYKLKFKQFLKTWSLNGYFMK